MGFIKSVWKNKFRIGLIVFVVTSISIGISLLMPKWYKATSTILPPSGPSAQFANFAALSGMNLGSLLGGGAEQTRVLSILKSRSIKEAVVKKFDLIEKYESENLEKAIESFGGNMSIVIGKEQQISVSISDKDQELVADMTHYLVHCLDSINIQLTNQEGKNVRLFIEERTEAVIDSLRDLETRLNSFLRGHNIISLEDQVSSAVMSAAELKSQIIRKEIELELSIRSNGLESPQTELVRIELQELQDKYQEFFSDIESSQNRLFPNLQEVPEYGTKIEEIKRNIMYYEKIIEYLGPQYEQARIEETKNIPTIQIVDAAVRPMEKSRPKRMKIVLATFFFSFIVSAYFVYFKEEYFKSE